MEFDRVSAKTDVVRWIGFVSKSQLEAKLLGIKLNRPLDVARAKNRVGFFEHCRSQTRGRGCARLVCYRVASHQAHGLQRRGGWGSPRLPPVRAEDGGRHAARHAYPAVT